MPARRWCPSDDRHVAYVVYNVGEAKRRYDLEFTRSDNRGKTWSPPAVLSARRVATNDMADHFYPMIAAAGDGLVFAVWFDDRDGPLSVWARRSTDGGRTWSADVRLSRPQGLVGIYGEYGGIGIDGDGVLHVAWSEGTGHVSQPGAKGGTWYARWDARAVAPSGQESPATVAQRRPRSTKRSSRQ